jgi:hypothetical protein
MNGTPAFKLCATRRADASAPKSHHGDRVDEGMIREAAIKMNRGAKAAASHVYTDRRFGFSVAELQRRRWPGSSAQR